VLLWWEIGSQDIRGLEGRAVLMECRALMVGYRARVVE